MNLAKYLGIAIALPLLFSCGGEGGDSPSGDQPIPSPSAPDGTSLIGSAGGTVELPGVAVVSVPPGAFSSETQIQISTTPTDDFADVFDEFTSMFSVSEAMDMAVRVEIEAVQPNGDMDVQLVVPEAMIEQNGQGQTIRVFAGMENESGLEETYPYFELVIGEVNTSNNTVSFQAEPAHFSRFGSISGNFFGLFVVALAPGGN